MQSYRLILLTLFIAAASPVRAADPLDARDYPELSSEALLPPIVRELKQTIADPYSMRDFTLCAARGIKLKDGKPIRWVVQFAFNAKNSNGGYAGLRSFAVRFSNGEIKGGLLPLEFQRNDGIEGLINSGIRKRMSVCPVIPDERIQQLITGSIFKPG